jgi:hypothetical protein
MNLFRITTFHTLLAIEKHTSLLIETLSRASLSSSDRLWRGGKGEMRLVLGLVDHISVARGYNNGGDGESRQRHVWQWETGADPGFEVWISKIFKG